MSEKASSWIGTILAALKDTDANTGRRVLEDCGRNCCQDSGMLDIAKELSETNAHLSDREKIAALNKRFADDVISFSIQDDVIYVEYSECACHLNKEDLRHDEFLCECTRGFCKHFLKTYLQRDVEVIILKTILRGDKKCLMSVVNK